MSAEEVNVKAAPWDPSDTVTYRYYAPTWRSPLEDLRALPIGSRVTFKWPGGETVGTITGYTGNGGMKIETAPPMTCN